MTIKFHTEARCGKIFMRRIYALAWSGLIAAFLLAPCSAIARSCDWKPTMQIVKKIESDLQMPNGLLLMSYKRFYSGKISKGHRIVLGEFVKADSPSIQIVDNKKLPHILDGGCSIVNFEYDVEQKKVLKLFCNGVG